MLIVTRQVGERIRLGANLEIEIQAIEGNEVAIAIHADKRAPFHATPPHKLYGTQEGRLFRAANVGHL